MWNAGSRFFWRFFLLHLRLLRDGVAHSLHDRIELGGIILGGDYIDISALVSLLLGKKEQDTKLLGKLLKLPHILLSDTEHLRRGWVTGQPL